MDSRRGGAGRKDRLFAGGRISDKQLALVLHFIEDPDAFMRSFLLAHPNFLADEIAKGGKSAQRAQLCIASGFAPEEALPKA